MRRLAGPMLPPGKGQVEQDRRRHDWHPDVAHDKTAPPSGETVHDTGGGVEPERRAARQHDGVDPLDERGWVEQFGLAAARRAAADIDRSDGRHLTEHDRRARHSGHVLGLADQQTGHIGDQVARTGFGHFFAPRKNALTIRPPMPQGAKRCPPQ
jgi:hypothetical protein